MTDLTPAAQRVQDAQLALLEAQADIEVSRQAEIAARDASRDKRAIVMTAQKELNDALTALATDQGVQTPEAAAAAVAAESAAAVSPDTTPSA